MEVANRFHVLISISAFFFSPFFLSFLPLSLEESWSQSTRGLLIQGFLSLMVGIGLLQIPAMPKRQKENAYVPFTSRSSLKMPGLFLPSYSVVFRPLVQTRISLAAHPVWTRQKANSVLAAPVDFSRTSFFPHIPIMTSFFGPLVFLAKVKYKEIIAKSPPPSLFFFFSGRQIMERRAQIFPRI